MNNVFNSNDAFFRPSKKLLCVVILCTTFGLNFSLQNIFENKNDQQLEEKLSERFEKVMGTWWPVVSNSNLNAATSTHGRFIHNLTNGFFNFKMNPIRKHIRTNHSVNPFKVNKTTLVNDTGRLFNNESDCVTASKRSCVCFMKDYLEFVITRLETTKKSKDMTVYKCQSYKPISSVFVILSSTNGSSAEEDSSYEDEEMIEPKDHSSEPSVEIVNSKQVDFNNIIDYHFENSTKNHFSVLYGTKGSDIKIRCGVLMFNGDNNNVGMTIKWDYPKSKHNTNSTVVCLDSGQLLITKLDPTDSKNYTCTAHIPKKKLVQNTHKHWVIVADNAIYEIRSTAAYKTKGICTPELITPIQMQLPNLIQMDVCPLGLSQYACSVNMEPPKCTNEKNILEIQYTVTLNYSTNYVKQIKDSKKCQTPVFYQKLMTKIMQVLAINLNKSMGVPLKTKLSPISTIFEPSSDELKTNNYVSCDAGFGLRDILCVACPLHHYSPNNSVECIKCPKGFHQLIVGSEKCVKCPSFYASGCDVADIYPYYYYIVGFICLLICVGFAFCCFSFSFGDKKKDNGLSGKDKKKKKKKKKKISYQPLENGAAETDDSNDETRSSFDENKNNNLESKRPFSSIHDKVGNQINPTEAESTKRNF